MKMDSQGYPCPKVTFLHFCIVLRGPCSPPSQREEEIKQRELSYAPQIFSHKTILPHCTAVPSAKCHTRIGYNHKVHRYIRITVMAGIECTRGGWGKILG